MESDGTKKGRTYEVRPVRLKELPLRPHRQTGIFGISLNTSKSTRIDMSYPASLEVLVKAKRKPRTSMPRPGGKSYVNRSTRLLILIGEVARC